VAHASRGEKAGPRLKAWSNLDTPVQENFLMKTIVMLGTAHLLHRVPGDDRIAELEKCLDYLKRRFVAQVVMEEWSEKKKESVAKAFAPRLGLPWANVGTPDEPQYWTYTGYINYPGYDGTLPEYDPDAPGMNEYGPFENQENRERRMAENVRAEMERYDVGLFILGTAHLHSVLGKLQSSGFKVVAFVL
jgi:hypothetical protein